MKEFSTLRLNYFDMAPKTLGLEGVETEIQ